MILKVTPTGTESGFAPIREDLAGVLLKLRQRVREGTNIGKRALEIEKGVCGHAVTVCRHLRRVDTIIVTSAFVS